MLTSRTSARSTSCSCSCPSSPHLPLAVEEDHKLFTDAFEKRIVIVSPTTLMMTLRIIHNVWRAEKQNSNAQEIARRGRRALRQSSAAWWKTWSGWGRN